jgi:Transposase IS116/IS110/IS902 family
MNQTGVGGSFGKPKSGLRPMLTNVKSNYFEDLHLNLLSSSIQHQAPPADAGYDVVENSSGTSVKGKTRISKKGNSHLRRTLHFPALCAVKYVPEMQNLYERVFDKTKVKLKAYVAVQRKLLVLIYTLFKNDAAYEPEQYLKTQMAMTKTK